LTDYVPCSLGNAGKKKHVRDAQVGIDCFVRVTSFSTFGALCFCWCDVELQKWPTCLVSGNSLSGADVFEDAFSGIPAMVIFWQIGFWGT